ncbi:MAG: TolC family protein [Flavobacteriales bacterium]|nr:TolC family protein [Flavobacteriales bacterium]
MRYIVLLVFLSVVLINPALGQEKWDLEKCINAAIENNLAVQRSTLQSELAEQNLTNAKGSHLPNVNLFLSSDLNFGRTIDPFTNTFATDEVRSDAYGISGQWQVFNGLQRYNRYKQSQYDVMAAKYDADKMVNDISLSVTQSYLQILFNKEILAIAQEQVDVTAKEVERTSKLVNAGSLPEGNLLDIQAQYAQEELNEVTAQNNLDISYLSLLILMRMDTLEDFEIATPQVSIESTNGLDATPSFVYLKAVETLPEVKSAEMRYISSEKSLSGERGRISPTITLRGSLGSGYSGKSVDPNSAVFTGTQQVAVTASGEPVLQPTYAYDGTKSFSSQVTDNFNQSLGVSISFPILNSLNTHTSISRAKVNKELAQNQYEQVKYQINETVKRAYFDATAARKKYLANEKTVTATRESFKYAEKRFQVGLLNALEYNQSKNNLMRAESQLLQAKYDFVFKSKILEFYMGQPLSLK